MIPFGVHGCPIPFGVHGCRSQRACRETSVDTERSGDAGVAGRLVLIAGATSASGLAAARVLASAEARVVAVGRDARRLDELSEAAPGVRTEVCDLTDEHDVTTLADSGVMELIRTGMAAGSGTED